jgi:hypothetical protein
MLAGTSTRPGTIPSDKYALERFSGWDWRAEAIKLLNIPEITATVVGQSVLLLMSTVTTGPKPWVWYSELWACFDENHQHHAVINVHAPRSFTRFPRVLFNLPPHLRFIFIYALT